MGAFSLPKGCLRELTKLCTNFLWSGTETKRGKAKVSWKSICLPKKEGGLGLRDFSTWNKTLQLRMLWKFFTDEDSLWIAWAKRHYLRKQNLWTATTTPSSSWTWRTLLNLRPLANQFITCKLGNGEQASFWNDNWSTKGQLIRITGQDGPQKTGIHIDKTVAEAYRQSRWPSTAATPRCPRLAELRAILQRTNTPTATTRPDQFQWGEATYYSTKKTWEILRPRQDTKSWAGQIWFKSCIPKHSFMFWTATLNRLPLRSRLQSWGINITDTCCICSGDSEERDHLFLKCALIKQLWLWLAQKLRTSCDFSSWQTLLDWIKGAPSHKQRIIRTLSAQTLVYTTWKERNSRLHNDKSSTLPALISAIDKTIRHALLARRTRKGHGDLLSIWFST